MEGGPFCYGALGLGLGPAWRQFCSKPAYCTNEMKKRHVDVEWTHARLPSVFAYSSSLSDMLPRKGWEKSNDALPLDLNSPQIYIVVCGEWA